MFPGPHAQVYYNEAGEPTGWDYPSDDPLGPCGNCGCDGHSESECGMDYSEDEEDDSDPTA